MRFVSLFAGVGGFDLGLERAGHECVGQVEIDKHASKVLANHWADVPRHDDVRTAKKWADQNGITGNVDLVAGGFPCQDLSVAGKRAGLAGSRSGLFHDAVDFATHVQAQVIILENVPGLLTSNQGRDFGTVLSELDYAGFHHIGWRVFDSQFFGVPQRRKRIFIIASAGNPRFGSVLIERESGTGDFAQGESQGESAATASAISFGKDGDYRSVSASAGFSNTSFGGYTASNLALSPLRVSGGDGAELLIVDQEEGNRNA